MTGQCSTKHRNMCVYPPSTTDIKYSMKMFLFHAQKNCRCSIEFRHNAHTNEERCLWTRTITWYKQVMSDLELLLWLGWFIDERLVDVWDNTSTGNCGLDKCVKFLVSTNGKLQVTRSDTLHFKIFTCVTGQLKDFGCKVLQNSRRVNGSGSTNTLALLYGSLQETVYTTDRELSWF